MRAPRPALSGVGQGHMQAYQPISQRLEGSAIRQLSSVPTNSLSWNVIFRDGSGQIREPREFPAGLSQLFHFYFQN